MAIVFDPVQRRQESKRGESDENSERGVSGTGMAERSNTVAKKVCLLILGNQVIITALDHGNFTEFIPPLILFVTLYTLA